MAVTRVRVPLFVQLLLQTPVMIPGQFNSRSAQQLQAFLNSPSLQRQASVRDLCYSEKKGPCNLQCEKYLRFL